MTENPEGPPSPFWESLGQTVERSLEPLASGLGFGPQNGWFALILVLSCGCFLVAAGVVLLRLVELRRQKQQKRARRPESVPAPPPALISPSANPHAFMEALRSGRLAGMAQLPAAGGEASATPADPCLLALLARAGVLDQLRRQALDPSSPLQPLFYRLLDAYAPRRPGSVSPTVAAGEPGAAAAVGSPASPEKRQKKNERPAPPSLQELLRAGLPEPIAGRLLAAVVLGAATPGSVGSRYGSEPALLKRPTVPLELAATPAAVQDLQVQQQQHHADTRTPGRHPQPLAAAAESPGLRALSQSVGQMRLGPSSRASSPASASSPSSSHTQSSSPGAGVMASPASPDAFRADVVPEDSPELRGRPLVQGWLLKRTGSSVMGVRRWQRRWFALLGRWLLYYSSQGHAQTRPRQPRGAIDLAQVVELGLRPGSDNVMELLSLDSLAAAGSNLRRSALQLQAADASEALEWLQRMVFARHHLGWGLPLGLPVLGVPAHLRLGSANAEGGAAGALDAPDGFFARYQPTEEEQEYQELVAQFRAALAETFGPDFGLRQPQGHADELSGQLYLREVRELDRACIRFLRARQFKVPVAVKMFREALEHRATHGFDILLRKPFLEAQRIKPSYLSTVHGRDKLGRPIYIELIGRFDIPHLLENFSMEELLRYHVHLHEYMRTKIMTDCSRAAGRRVDQVTTILDLKGLGRKHMNRKALNFVQSIAHVDQLVFPEMLGQSFIINAPSFFSGIWKLIRPLLDERTKNKIRVISGDPSSALLELIDPQQLPAFLGGQCQCRPAVAAADGSAAAEDPFGGCLTHSREMREYTQFAPLGSDLAPLGI